MSTDAHPLDQITAWLAYAKLLRWQKGFFDQSSYHAALRASSLGIEPQQVFDYIATTISANGGHLRVAKLRSQIRRAYSYAKGDATATADLSSDGKIVAFPSPHKWPEPDRVLIEKTALGYGGLSDLWEQSPVRFASEVPPRTELIIDGLFPGNPLLCVGRSVDEFFTATREELRGDLAKTTLIVPSPMSKVYGVTKDGRKSMHCEDNTGPRRFIVVEFDSGEEKRDEQAALLLHLRETAPLALVVWSGRRSLQGWFYCAGQEEQKLREWFVYAVRLGADRALWSRCQFVRLAEAWRPDTLKVQTCYYFAPETVQEDL